MNSFYNESKFKIKKKFEGGEGGGARVSEFFLLSIQT